MFLYGGIGLFLAGLVFLVAADKVTKDPQKAAKARKQAPILMVVGVIGIGIAVVLGGMLG